MSWRTALTLALLVGAVFSAWSLLSNRGSTPATDGALGGRPDYVLNEFELVALNAQGKESFTLRAPQLTRDPDAETMDIAQPLFLIPPPETGNGDAWKVRADTGWISAAGDELRLRGAVKAISDGRKDAPVTIITEQLNVFPDADRVDSAVAVTIDRPGSILRGHGLEVNLANKQYTLRSEVRSHYVP
ncbi:MAG: LPS export ABC transporter periplasmic protein LptC [Lysobacter sp.]